MGGGEGQRGWAFGRWGRRDDPRNDFRHGTYDGPVLGSGNQFNILSSSRSGPRPTAIEALRELPEEFTGREQNLKELLDHFDPDAAHVSGSPVAVISGLGGLGKTTLAYAVGNAAREKGWFTKFAVVDLHGASETPVEAEEVLAALLRALGVEDWDIPLPGERQALYLSRLNVLALHGQRVLVIADNAALAGQVDPLRPPAPHGLLVTSRRALPGLGRLHQLGLLAPEAAVSLLAGALHSADRNDSRITDDSEAAARLAAACGYIPLALQIVAGSLITGRGSVSKKADKLSGPDGRLDHLKDSERSMRAVFDQSFALLPAEQADILILIALMPGPDIATTAAALLADRSEEVAESLLEQLITAQLLRRSTTPERWDLHDLVREHARSVADRRMTESRPVRRRYQHAQRRLADHYVRRAEAADTHLRRDGGPADAAFANRTEALAWFDRERANLIATAQTEGLTSRTLDLVYFLGPYLLLRREIEELVLMFSLAIQISRPRHPDRATSWHNLGRAFLEARRFDEALEAAENAHTMFHRLHLPREEADARKIQGLVHMEMRRFDEAISVLESALACLRAVGYSSGMADILNELGSTYRELRRYDDAISFHEKALALYRDLKDEHAEAHVRNNLGLALRQTWRLDEAATVLDGALVIYRKLDDRHGEASVLWNLGGVLRLRWKPDDALAAYEKAQAIFAYLKDTHLEAKTWDAIGTMHFWKREFGKAAGAYARAREIFRDGGDVFGEACVVNNIGNVHRDTQDGDEAAMFYQEALAVFRRLGEDYNVATTLNNLGRARSEAGRFSEAIDILRTAADMFRTFDDPTAEMTARKQLAEALWQSERLEEAEVAEKRLIALMNEHGERLAPAAELVSVMEAAGGPGEEWIMALARSTGFNGPGGDRGETDTAEHPDRPPEDPAG